MALHFSVLHAEAILGMTMPENQDGRKHAVNQQNTDYTHNTSKSAEDTSGSGSHGGSKKLFETADRRDNVKSCSLLMLTCHGCHVDVCGTRTPQTLLQILEMPRWNFKFKRVKNSYVISMKLWFRKDFSLSFKKYSSKSTWTSTTKEFHRKPTAKHCSCVVTYSTTLLTYILLYLVLSIIIVNHN